MLGFSYPADECVRRHEWERYEERDEHGDDVEFDYDGGTSGTDGTLFPPLICPLLSCDHSLPRLCYQPPIPTLPPFQPRL